MATFLLIVHSVLAVTLLGAVTHQAMSVWWTPSHRNSTFARFRAVPAAPYTNAIICLYAATAVLGAVIYPIYRVDVRGLLEQISQRDVLGLFEIKEHVVAIGFGLLPAYWFYWRGAATGHGLMTRKLLTGLIAAIVWWGFIVGHIVNNVKGFGL